MDDLPERMLRGGRPVDPYFDPGEWLYHRCTADGTEPDPEDAVCRRLKPAAVRFPEFSVNRSKYSEPADVLLPDWPHWGVVRFEVRHVPPRVAADEAGSAVEFQVEHDPEPENYSHSEVRAYKNSRRVDRSSRISDQVKSKFRQLLCEKTRVVIDPKV